MRSDVAPAPRKSVDFESMKGALIDIDANGEVSPFTGREGPLIGDERAAVPSRVPPECQFELALHEQDHVVPCRVNGAPNREAVAPWSRLECQSRFLEVLRSPRQWA
jgi:hypothetical protein